MRFSTLAEEGEEGASLGVIAFIIYQHDLRHQIVTPQRQDGVTPELHHRKDRDKSLQHDLDCTQTGRSKVAAVEFRRYGSPTRRTFSPA